MEQLKCPSCGAPYLMAQAHLNYIHPFPKNFGAILKNYEKILIPEMNMGQLLMLIRNQFPQSATEMPSFSS